MKTIFNWELIEVNGNRTGSKKTVCPNCSESRRNKKDPCLSVNFDKGVAHCFHCEAVSFKEESNTEIKKHYVEPPQDWENHTKLSDGMVKYCAERSIPQRILIEYGITEERQWIPALGKEANCITFNYFEGSKLVNKKFRDARKNFAQTKDSKRILYNINAAIGAETLYIVEGEFDVLAMAAQGIKNAVSLVNGANDHDEQWINSERYLSDVKRFIIATDNDEKGIDVREKIAHRLGRYRCSFIEWNSKDANGSALNGTFDQDIKSEKRFPVSGTFTIDELKGDILSLYDNGLPKTIKPKHHTMERLGKIFSVMRGHLVTVTGIPSHGKSNWTEWYVLNLVYDHAMKASFFSPEHQPMSLHQSTFIEKAIGKNFWNDKNGERITREDIERYTEWANERIYVTSPDKGTLADWDWLLEKFKEQLFSYGVDIFVIDAFNKVAMPSGNRLDAINDVLTKLTSFAQANDVIIFLVAHPTKMKKNDAGIYEVPSLYDVSGSADFRNQTHDGFTVYRKFESKETGEEGCTEIYNMKTKYKFQGEIGERVEFIYDLPTGRYYEKGTNPPRFDMTKPWEEQTIAPTAMRPNETFAVLQDIDYDEEDEQDAPF
jgi:twinkle protein